MDTSDVQEILQEMHSDVVFAVEDGVVWVSGMNSNCRTKANDLAQTLVSRGIPASLVHEDSADEFGGVQFRFGANA